MLIFKGRPIGGAAGPYFFILPNLGWNDYSFVTLFRSFYVDSNGQELFVGELKVGFAGQDEQQRTADFIPSEFSSLETGFFSLGQSPEYYETLEKNLSNNVLTAYLVALKDVVYDNRLFDLAYREASFVQSLTRFVSLSSIKGHFRGILHAPGALRSYGLKFTEEATGVEMDFSVFPDSRPPSNIHVLIGRNGVGKSYILKRVANSIDKNDGAVTNRDRTTVRVEDFGLLLYFSLGVFGNPLDDIDFNDSEIDKYKTKKKYIGIYDQKTRQLKSVTGGMAVEFAESLKNCLLGSEVKKELWLSAVRSLSVDVNFQELNISSLLEELDENRLIVAARELFVSLSSGHAAVIYYVTSVVELVEDRTICLFDEPENHLHPPLLSTFVRVLSELLAVKNGLAIIATHSPVIVQEAPRSCVWKVNRLAGGLEVSRPCIETFGESVGEITTEVFNLDVRNSGFYKLLANDSKNFRSYDDLLEKYNRAIGLEGRAVVSSSMRKGRYHG
ncbi:AAA family ATPase [Pseudomonas germanica]|uniref:AAA family ATPase n=1 Tax=Pseudomonas germanica TaxID=2815720 RepID=A0ABX8YU83_9PSED|nr:AAA family ATPase [Pseudomonas germanica]QYY82973.1 AAA family ATPase [Pseudomonas germanica]